MSPSVPEPLSPRASITTTSPSWTASNACFCALNPPPNRREQVLAARDEAQRAGDADELQVGAQRAHAVDARGVEPALAQLRGQAGDRRVARAARGGPHPGRCSPQRAGRRQHVSPTPPPAARRRRPAGSRAPGRTGGCPATTRVTRRPEVGAPGALGRVDLDLDHVAGHDHGRPGRRAGEDDVPRLEREVLGEVGDDLRQREEQVLRWCRPGPAAPLTQVRTRSAAGSTVRASIRSGPSGVKPSPPFDRRFEPRSFARRSYSPKSLPAVTHATWSQAWSTVMCRAAVPMTRATSPSNASSSVPAGRSIVPPVAATELEGFRK